MKKRLYSDLKKLAVILITGFIYYIWVKLTDLRIPCLFYVKTGFLCPGCGITRMIVSILNFDLVSAYAYNKLMFVSLPFILAFLIYMRVKYIRSGSSQLSKLQKITVYAFGIIVIIFTIIRNII